MGTVPVVLRHRQQDSGQEGEQYLRQHRPGRPGEEGEERDHEDDHEEILDPCHVGEVRRLDPAQVSLGRPDLQAVAEHGVQHEPSRPE